MAGDRRHRFARGLTHVSCGNVAAYIGPSLLASQSVRSFGLRPYILPDSFEYRTFLLTHEGERYHADGLMVVQPSAEPQFFLKWETLHRCNQRVREKLIPTDASAIGGPDVWLRNHCHA
jgi:hypothetical protein